MLRRRLSTRSSPFQADWRTGWGGASIRFFFAPIWAMEREVSGYASTLYPTHDDETVMNGAPWFYGFD